MRRLLLPCSRLSSECERAAKVGTSLIRLQVHGVERVWQGTEEKRSASVTNIPDVLTLMAVSFLHDADTEK